MKSVQLLFFFAFFIFTGTSFGSNQETQIRMGYEGDTRGEKSLFTLVQFRWNPTLQRFEKKDFLIEMRVVFENPTDRIDTEVEIEIHNSIEVRPGVRVGVLPLHYERNFRGNPDERMILSVLSLQNEIEKKFNVRSKEFTFFMESLLHLLSSVIQGQKGSSALGLGEVEFGVRSEHSWGEVEWSVFGYENVFFDSTQRREKFFTALEIFFKSLRTSIMLEYGLRSRKGDMINQKFHYFEVGLRWRF